MSSFTDSQDLSEQLSGHFMFFGRKTNNKLKLRKIVVG